jgi:hypothetical protein
MPDNPHHGSLFFEDFNTLAAVNNNATYRNGRSVHCTHKLRNDAFDLHGAAHGRGFRIVAAPGQGDACDDAGACAIRDAAYLSSRDGLLGFSSFHTDTLGASGAEPWHNIGQGAFVGLERVPGGGQAFALRAEGVLGFVAVCSNPVVLSADSVRASARIYASRRGWDGPNEELRVWADFGGAGPDGGISLLPNCTAVATAQNIDSLGLRSPSNTTSSDGPSLESINPNWPRGNLWRDAAWALMKDRLAEDTWDWRDLSVSLGRLQDNEARVCVGLQGGGSGATALFVDRLQLTPQTCDAQLPSSSCEQTCAPSPLLVGPSAFATLAVPGSCGLSLDPSAMRVLYVLAGCAALVAIVRISQMLRQSWRLRRQLSTPGLEVTLGRALA